jgi:hypothetical protein
MKITKYKFIKKNCLLLIAYFCILGVFVVLLSLVAPSQIYCPLHFLLINRTIKLKINYRYFSSNNNFDSINPVIKYENADLSKKLIIKENKEKSGIYR